jgi:hypothetical protein
VLPGIPGLTWAVVPLILTASIAMLGFGWVAAAALRPRTTEWNESGWAHQTRSAP